MFYLVTQFTSLVFVVILLLLLAGAYLGEIAPMASAEIAPLPTHMTPTPPFRWRPEHLPYLPYPRYATGCWLCFWGFSSFFFFEVCVF